jgi:carbonic anhydrase
LIDGNARFTAGAAEHPRQSAVRRSELAQTQEPFAVILACADSRVAPEIVFDQGLGDLFVVRVAGNVLDNAALGSIEYAVEHLHASLIVVLGHERCGAVTAAVKGGHTPGHIHSFVQAIEPAVAETKGAPGDAVDNAVRANVRHVVQQLRRARPIVSEAVVAGKVSVAGARYDLDTGAVEFLP